MTGQTIMIASGKGGVGKSTLAVTLGAALQKAGKRVVLLDLDFGIRALDLFTHVENAPYHLLDVLLHRCRPADALIPLNKEGGLLLCPAAPQQPETSACWQQLAALTALLRTHYDVILLDCPAGVSDVFRAACGCATHVLLLTTPEAVPVRSATYCRSVLQQLVPETPIRLIINRVRNNPGDNPITDFDTIIDQTGVQLLGVLPEAAGLSLAESRGQLTGFQDARYTKAVSRIAGRLFGISSPLLIS